jgi:hypothetical protein
VTKSDLDELVADGRIELVPADVPAATALLEEAARHLSSAAAIASTDPNGAYSLLYEGGRKAVTAHMLARGYRVAGGRLGGHEAVVLYAEASLSESPYSEHVAQLDSDAAGAQLLRVRICDVRRQAARDRSPACPRHRRGRPGEPGLM